MHGVPSEARLVVDGTVGGGGHAAAILARYPEIQLLGVDRDLESLARCRETLKPFEDRVTLVQGTYADLPEHLAAVGWPDKVDAILLDLGVNSHQLDTPERGFSFRFDGPLDMRFQTERSDLPTAAEILQTWDEEEIARILWEYGEERQSRKIARRIVQRRGETPFREIRDLLAILVSVLGPPRRDKIHPATRTFQALRIAVNRELEHLDRFLAGFSSWLRTGGHVAILSFHSLEDRKVKLRFRELAQPEQPWPPAPAILPTLELLHRKAIPASESEAEANPRARSAKLRSARRL